MPSRSPNHRLAKIHRNYTVEEVAALYRVHRNTVRQWVRAGLPTTDLKRPALIHGSDLAAFLKARRLKNKRPCHPGEIYCVRCRAPRVPAGGMADYEPKTATSGDLVGICPSCDTWMYRRVSLARLSAVRGVLEIALPHGVGRIDESTGLSVNNAFRHQA